MDIAAACQGLRLSFLKDRMEILHFFDIMETKMGRPSKKKEIKCVMSIELCT